MTTEARKKATAKYHGKQCGITIRVSQEQHDALERAAGAKSIQRYLLNLAERDMQHAPQKEG